MSYPEPVYSGSTGKVSATLRPADQAKALSEHERAEFFLRHDNHWL
jgi:hypothetical protein